MARELQPCGTQAAYQRHRYHGEKPCDACREAETAYRRARAGRTRPTVYERFIAKVSVDRGGCWLWTGGLMTGGYPRLAMGARDGVLAHRWSYEHHIGPIPDGLQLDHLCRVRHCVNPDHLEPVTARENVLRSTSIPARLALRTTCVNGHPFEGDNLRMEGTVRRCRACKRAEAHRRKARLTGSTS